jgi:hypothetical protein
MSANLLHNTYNKHSNMVLIISIKSEDIHLNLVRFCLKHLHFTFYAFLLTFSISQELPVTSVIPYPLYAGSEGGGVKFPH